MGSLGEALLTAMEANGHPRAGWVREVVQRQLRREEGNCTSGSVAICTERNEAEPLSLTASRILQDIVPWAINQLRQNPSAAKCRQLIGELRKRSKGAGEIKGTALRKAAEDLDTLKITIEMTDGRVEECRAAVQSHKWRKLLGFLHTVT